MALDLCLSPQAEKPFFIENISTNVYTLEELCFYLCGNVYLIDRSIMNEALCDWLRDELGYKRLSRQLYELLESGEGAERVIPPILREIGYLEPKAMKDFQEKLTRLTVQPEEEREKFKGDHLVRSGMYESALEQYRLIIEKRRPGKAGADFYAGIWNNMGCAYARLFRFEEAADCFKKAWNEVRTREVLRKYISVLPLYLDGQEYEDALKELGADRQLTRLISQYTAQICQDAEQAVKQRREESGSDAQQLAQLKDEYRRSVNCLLSPEDSD